MIYQYNQLFSLTPNNSHETITATYTIEQSIVRNTSIQIISRKMKLIMTKLDIFFIITFSIILLTFEKIEDQEGNNSKNITDDRQWVLGNRSINKYFKVLNFVQSHLPHNMQIWLFIIILLLYKEYF